MASSSVKILVSISMAVLLLATQYGCVASRRDISHIENRTAEIQEELHRLQKEMEQRLKAVERLDGKYDYNNSLLADRRPLDRVIDSIVTIKTQTVFETYRTSERVVRVSRGIGVVADRHVLTLDHVVTQNTLEIATPFGEVHVPSKKVREKTYLVFQDRELVLEEVFRDPELDIALFRIPAKGLNLPSLPCPLGNSDELTVGTFLYVVGNPFNSGINMREGIVSSLLGLEGVEKISARRSDLFVISNGVVPGDSGAPVLVLRDGIPELVGIVQGTLGSTRIGWAIKINPILMALSKHLGSENFCIAQENEPPAF